MHDLQSLKELNAAAIAKMVEPKHLWAIIRPMQSNAGRPFTPEHHDVWDNGVIDLFGGATFLPVADGAWKHGGKVFREPMQAVQVIATEKEIANLVSRTMLYYDQLAIMFYRVSETVHIVHRKDVVKGANETA
jgi:hypothetical protein